MPGKELQGHNTVTSYEQEDLSRCSTAFLAQLPGLLIGAGTATTAQGRLNSEVTHGEQNVHCNGASLRLQGILSRTQCVPHRCTPSSRACTTRCACFAERPRSRIRRSCRQAKTRAGGGSKEFSITMWSLACTALRCQALLQPHSLHPPWHYVLLCVRSPVKVCAKCTASVHLVTL